MGQSIGWYRLPERSKTDGWKTVWADDIPDSFDAKFVGRWEWFQTIYDVPYERIVTCGCCQNGATYGCDTSWVIKPTDIPAFREKLNAKGLLEPDEDGDNIFRDMTNWLEQHPDVYVEYS